MESMDGMFHVSDGSSYQPNLHDMSEAVNNGDNGMDGMDGMASTATESPEGGISTEDIMGASSLTVKVLDENTMDLEKMARENEQESIATQSMGAADPASNPTITTTTSATASASDYESITQNVAIILDKKLDSTKLWAKKLLRAISVYAKEMEEAQTEYVRIQRLEHEEATRLDQLEPDVQGATSSFLSSLGVNDAGGTSP